MSTRCGVVWCVGCVWVLFLLLLAGGGEGDGDGDGDGKDASLCF